MNTLCLFRLFLPSLWKCLLPPLLLVNSYSSLRLRSKGTSSGSLIQTHPEETVILPFVLQLTLFTNIIMLISYDLSYMSFSLLNNNNTENKSNNVYGVLSVCKALHWAFYIAYFIWTSLQHNKVDAISFPVC